MLISEDSRLERCAAHAGDRNIDRDRPTCPKRFLINKLESGSGDTTSALVRGAVAIGSAAIGRTLGDPVAVAILNEFGQYFTHGLLAPIVTSGYADFGNDLSERLHRLEEAGRISVAGLLGNEPFVEAVGVAIRQGAFTARGEKRRALRNAVLNCALSPRLDALERRMSFALIDRLTELHLLMLKVLADPEKWPNRKDTRPAVGGLHYAYASY
jgi:hypothetical protein